MPPLLECVCAWGAIMLTAPPPHTHTHFSVIRLVEMKKYHLKCKIWLELGALVRLNEAIVEGNSVHLLRRGVKRSATCAAPPPPLF